MFVPLSNDGVNVWDFKLVCPGNAMSYYHDRLFLLKNATVNKNLGFDDVCKEKHVHVAYNNEPNWFEVRKSTGEMVKYPVDPIVGYFSVAWEWEVQAAFFAFYNIKPQWINANYTWGVLNYTTGQWSGAVGLIQRDEADYAVKNYIPSYEMIKVADLSPTLYAPLHWVTCRREVSPIWNLLGLFTILKFLVLHKFLFERKHLQFYR